MSGRPLAGAPQGAFGAVLRRLRTERGWTQSFLAQRAGLDHSAVSKLESGVWRPRRATVERLIAALWLEWREGDALRVAAGYLPSVAAELLVTDEAVWELARYLADERVPPLRREEVRLAVRALLRQAQGEGAAQSPEG